MPKYLTAGAIVLALWVAIASREPWTGILPGTLIGLLAAADWRLWEKRGRPWHDWTVILLLLPAIFAAVWIPVGGPATGVGGSGRAGAAFGGRPGGARG